MAAFMASLLFVVLAEMGDKTQLLAMAFATKYRAHKVLIAVLLATLLNHSLAVIAGHFLAAVIPLDIISLISSFKFPPLNTMIPFGKAVTESLRINGLHKMHN